MTHAISTAGALGRRRIYNPVQKDAVTFLQTAAETGGARSVLEVEVAPGGGNSLHWHATYAERFEPLEGTLTVTVGDRTLRLAPGEAATAEAEERHAFRNDTDVPVVFRIEVTPGHPGFERSLQIAYGLAADGLTRPDGMPKSILHGALLVELSESRVPGVVGIVTRLLRPVAWLARRRGVEAALVERYVIT